MPLTDTGGHAVKSWIVDDEIKADPHLYSTVELQRANFERIYGKRLAPRTSVRWTHASGGVNLWIADEAYPEGVETFIPAKGLSPKHEADHHVRLAMSAMLEPTTDAMLDGIWAGLETIDG